MSEQPQASAITTSEISNCLMIFKDEDNVFFIVEDNIIDKLVQGIPNLQ